MDKNYREYLERELQEAQERFEEIKKEVIRDVENITTWNAQDFGAAYFCKIDHITQAGQKVQTLARALQVYGYFENEKEEA